MLKLRHPAGIAIPYYKAIGASLLGALLLIGCASQPPAPQPQPQDRPAEPARTEPLEPSAPAPQVKSDAPQTYVVKKGDTLWDISSMFLNDPWLWPEIWYVNPQIENPHLIYPGDIIRLVWINGQAHLQIERNGQVIEATAPGVKLSPEVRTQPLDEAIPTIPLSAVAPFLREARVVTDDELDDAPYVLRSVDGRLMSGAGTSLYVRGGDFKTGQSFDVVRKQDPYVDPKTGDTLGFAALRIGSGSIVRTGDPATFELRHTNREVMDGDHLLPPLESLRDNFLPHKPADSISGQIISVVDGVSQIGQYQVVVLNRGASDGLDTGTMLAVYRRGVEMEDPESGDDVQLPNERVGLLMVFRSFDKVSFGLIMHATSEIHVEDVVTTP